MVSSLSAAPAISFSVGSSGVSGIGGHQDSSAKVAAASVSASVVSRSSSEEGSSTASPAPSGPVILLEPVAEELVTGERRSSECPELQGASCPGGLDGRRPWCLVADELGPGFRCGKRTTRVASGIHPQHIHIGTPYRWNRGRTRWL